MLVEFDKSFKKSLRKIKDRALLSKIEDTILQLESAKQLSQIKNIQKMQGYTSYYRIKLGDYRIGLELAENNVINLILVAHRKDIYRQFP